jgi:hypothetical protein
MRHRYARDSCPVAKPSRFQARNSPESSLDNLCLRPLKINNVYVHDLTLTVECRCVRRSNHTFGLHAPRVVRGNGSLSGATSQKPARTAQSYPAYSTSTIRDVER